MNKIVSLWRKYLEIWREKNLIQIISKNTRIYNHSSGPHITHFFPCCCQGTEKFQVDVYFEASEHSVQTADDNSKLTSTSF